MVQVDVGPASVYALQVVCDVVRFGIDYLVHRWHCDQRSVKTRNNREEVQTSELYKNHVVEFEQCIGPEVPVTDGSGGCGDEIER